MQVDITQWFIGGMVEQQEQEAANLAADGLKHLPLVVFRLTNNVTYLSNWERHFILPANPYERSFRTKGSFSSLFS